MVQSGVSNVQLAQLFKTRIRQSLICLLVSLKWHRIEWYETFWTQKESMKFFNRHPSSSWRALTSYSFYNYNRKNHLYSHNKAHLQLSSSIDTAVYRIRWRHRWQKWDQQRTCDVYPRTNQCCSCPRSRLHLFPFRKIYSFSYSLVVLLNCFLCGN